MTASYNEEDSAVLQKASQGATASSMKEEQKAQPKQGLYQTRLVGDKQAIERSGGEGPMGHRQITDEQQMDGQGDKLPSYLPSNGHDLGKTSDDAYEDTEMIDTSSTKTYKDDVRRQSSASNIYSDQGNKQPKSGMNPHPKAQTDPISTFCYQPTNAQDAAMKLEPMRNEDKDSMQAADTTQLNRQEKQSERLDDFLNDHQKYVVNELIGWINSLFNKFIKERQILLHETNIFPNFSEDMLRILVMQEEWPEGIEKENGLYKFVIQNCKKRLLQIATQDILVLAQLADIDGEEREWIIQNYQEMHQIPFLDKLKSQVNQGHQNDKISQKVLAFTYTLAFDLCISENADGRISFRSISSFQSEQEIIKKLHQFYESETEIVFLLDANYITDKKHMSLVKQIVEKVERDAYARTIWKGCKTVIIMLHMQRNFNDKNYSQIPVFDDSWRQIVYYDTSLEPFTLTKHILMKNTRQLLIDQQEIKFEEFLKNTTEKCLLKITFDGDLSQDDQESINQNMLFIIKNITVDPQLVENLKNKILKTIKSQLRIIDWKDEICCNIDVIKNSANVKQAIRMVIEANYEQFLSVLLYQIENESSFRSYFTEFSEAVDGQSKEIRERIKLIQKIWIECFNQLKSNQIELKTLSQSKYASFIRNLKFPFSRSEVDILKEIFKKQVAFENGCEETDQTLIDHFSQLYIARTKFGNLIDEIIKDKYLQDVYIEDLVKIFLIENLLKPQYLTIVLIIMKIIKKKSSISFYEKLYLLMKHQKLFFSLCTILELFQQLKGDRFSLKDLEREFQEQLCKMSQGQNWEEIICKIVDVYIIKNSHPQQYALHNLKSINNMSTIYEKFYNNLFNFKSTVNIKNLPIIRFWSDFTALVAEQGDLQQNFLFKCSEIALKIDGQIDDNESDEDNLKSQEDEPKFMSDDGFIKMILVFYETGCEKLVTSADSQIVKVEEAKKEEEKKEANDQDQNQIVEHEVINQDERTVKFLSSFFTFILEKNFKRLSIFAKRFQMPQYKSLFRYSSAIFQEIMRHTQLLQYVDEFRINVQNEEVAVDVTSDVTSEIKLPDSFELEVLEKVLANVGLESKFAIAINDVITKQISDNTEKRVFSLNLLAKEFQLHQWLLVQLLVPEAERIRKIQYPNVKSLVAHAVLKTICDVYADLIFFNNLERERQVHQEWEIVSFEENKDLMESRLIIENELAKREWGTVRTLQMYCLNQLKQKMNIRNVKFKVTLAQQFAPHAEWIAESEALHDNQESLMPLDSYAQILEVQEAQEEFIRYLKNFLKYRLLEHKMHIVKIIHHMNTVQDFLKTGLAFLKACYIQYADEKHKGSFNELQVFYQDELQEIAEIKCGKQYAILLKNFISNFPIGNFLRMENNLPQADMHQRLLSCQILLHTFAHSKTPNPISSLFYSYNKDGKFALDVTQFKGCFMPGVELDPKYQYLFDFYTNYQDKKNKWAENYEGGTYICGDGCDFIFVVGEDGTLGSHGTCPWCYRDIGSYKGQYGRLQPRSGFRRCKEQDAKEFLRKVLVKYEQQQQPGYSVIEHGNLQDLEMSFYKTRPLSWRLIRQFVHIPLYFLETVGGCTQDTFNQVISVQNLQAQQKKTANDFLQSHIVNDFKVLEKLLSIGGQDHIAPWLYSVINRYSTVFNAGKGMDLKSNQNARAFEEAFDTQVLANLTEKISDVAIEYKNSLQVKEGKAMSDFDAAFQEIVAVKSIYPGIQFYRLARVQSFEDMIASFKNVKANELAFPILKVCINQYETLLKLRQLYPIIEFTNHLIAKFSHMINREDARNQRIKDHFQQNDEGRQLKALFYSFLKAWAQIGTDSLLFGCHVVPKLHYDENSELIHFLPDKKEMGNGIAMVAATLELGQLQNNILDELLHEYAKQKQLQSKYVLDPHQYPIQRIKPHHIVSFSIDDPQMIKAFAMNSLAFGHGQEVVYDFGQMEMNMLKDFEQLKFVSIDLDSFDYIQYQMEIFTLSGGKKNFILEIREHIKQSPFDRETSINVDQYFQFIENRGLVDNIQTLRDLHSGLEKILCFLQNTPQDGENTIEDFVNQKMKGKNHRVYSETTTLSHIKLKNIIALYEKLEEKYFPHITKSILPDYMSMKNEREILTTIEGILRYSEVAPSGAAVNQGQLIPTRQQIQNALIRFIMRCLAGEFRKEDLLGVWFVSKYDVWDEELYLEQNYKLENFQNHMSTTDIKLEDAYCTYKVMNELNYERNLIALAPLIGEHDDLRVGKRKINVPQPISQPPPQKPQTQAKKKQPAGYGGYM